MKLFKSIGLSAAFVCGATFASASTIFPDLASFQAASATIVESFEDPRGPSSASHIFPNFTISETGGTNGIAAGTPALFPFGLVSGTGTAVYDDNGASLLVFNAFSSPITAFGTWITADTNATVDVSGSVTASFTLVANVAHFFGVTKVGGISDITFDVSGSPLVAVDDVYTGSVSAVPLPAGGLLLLGGLAGLAALRRRTKS